MITGGSCLDSISTSSISTQYPRPNSLSLIHNRTSPTESLNTFQYDCQEHYKNFFFYDEQTHSRLKFYCKSWRCSTCYDRQRRKLKRKIMHIAIARNMVYFWTFTIDHKVCGMIDSYDYLSDCWNKFIYILRRKYPSIKREYIRVNEAHPNSRYAHLHFLTNQWLSVKEMRKIWTSVGGGIQMKAKRITGVKGVAKYLGKYMTKETCMLPKGKRHYSISYNLRELLPKILSNSSIKLMLEICIDNKLYTREVCRQDWANNFIYISEVQNIKECGCIDEIWLN